MNKDNPRGHQLRRSRQHSGWFSLCSSVSSVVVVLFLFGCYGGAPKHPSWKNATGGEQYERLMWQAIRDKEWSSVHSHLAPGFIGVDSSGRMFDRDAWEDHWKARAPKEFSIAELSVQSNGPDMVVTYVLHLGAESERRVVSVWQEVKGGWILIASSQTPILPN
jgi:hypothetical protein